VAAVHNCFAVESFSGLKNAYECIKAFSESDFTEDLKKLGAH
jgi:hypothetical protein